MAEGDNAEYVDAVSEDEEVVFNHHPAAGDMGRRVEDPKRTLVKIENFNGDSSRVESSSQDWTTWLQVFERVARMNRWGNEIANQLFAHLRGPALEVACNLPVEESENYDSLVAALETQFGPVKQSEVYLAELRHRVKKATESYRELGRSITLLCKRAYPNLSHVDRERIARTHFVDAIPVSELRLLVLQGKPGTINEAIQLAEELDGYRKLELQRDNKTKGYVRNVNETPDSGDRLSSLEDKMNTVLQVVSSRSFGSKKSNESRVCWSCSQRGHVARDCPHSRRNRPSRLQNSDLRGSQGIPQRKSQFGQGNSPRPTQSSGGTHRV